MKNCKIEKSKNEKSCGWKIWEILRISEKVDKIGKIYEKFEKVDEKFKQCSTETFLDLWPKSHEKVSFPIPLVSDLDGRQLFYIFENFWKVF